MEDQLNLFEEIRLETQSVPDRAYFGCAGWSIPKQAAELFPVTGTHLERYASILNGVEINSSFYRPHRQSTYARWADSVPDHFRFSIKFPKEVTHDNRLSDSNNRIPEFLIEISGLGPKLGPLLVQLPPSLQFAPDIAAPFFSYLRDSFDGHVVCEPRHSTWFTDEALACLEFHNVGRVGADPSVVPEAIVPIPFDSVVYVRLHGSPVMYVSAYPADYIRKLVADILQWQAENQVWVMFDNTSVGAAWYNAVDVKSLLLTS